MSYRINDNTVRILVDKDNNISLAIRLMIEAIHRESSPKTPRKTGSLRANIRKNVTGKRGSIRWGQRYAAAQEVGHMTVKAQRVVTTDGGETFFTLKPGRYYFKKYTTPGTGAHFAENAVKKVAGNYRRYFKLARLA